MRALLLLGLFASAASAHIGSPDVYLDAQAGPYLLFVTIQPPTVIPGVAQIQVRTASSGVTAVTAAPLGMTSASSRFAPVPDRLQPAKDDPQFFTGAAWLMQTGSFQIRINVSGPQGEGVVSVPIPAISQSTKGMQPALGAFLFGLMALLVVGLAAISGAAVGEAELEPGIAATPRQRLRGRVVMALAFLFLIAAVWFGNRWWGSEAAAYSQHIYKPLAMSATLEQERTLLLRISDPGWLTWRQIDDFVPDHDHLMHLYAIRAPGLDRLYHLHPVMTKAGLFTLDLPAMDAGHYRLYADVVHRDGFPETMVAQIDLPAISGRPLQGDDAAATAMPASEVTQSTFDCVLPDGYRMRFTPAVRAFHANRPSLFPFQLLDPQGNAPKDMTLYMGMQGHAAFVKTDGSVFAHIHPNGTVSMAAFMLAQGGPPMPMDHDMGGMVSLPNTVSFPYGFPVPGHYRIFVQMKHGNTIETGVFDAIVN